MSSLFGGTTISPSQINFNPANFNVGSTGLTGTYTGGGGFNLQQTQALSSQVGQLQNTFGQAASAFGALGATVQPGFSQFRQAGLADIANQQAQATSNLSNNLAQRRVLGSSFAQNQLSNNAATFAQQQADFTAQSYVQELQASTQLTQQQFQAATQQFSVGINQMNFEAGIAAQLSSQASSSLANIATAQAQLDQQAAQFNATQNSNALAGLGKLAGTFLGLGTGTNNSTIGGNLFSSAGSGISNLFGGGTAAGAGISNTALASNFADPIALAALI
jgi:hypothetical protein